MTTELQEVTPAMLEAGCDALMSTAAEDWVTTEFIEWRNVATCGGLNPEYLQPLVRKMFLAMLAASSPDPMHPRHP